MVSQAIILAGGLGTRLRSAVADRPKSMALVSGRPFLEYLVAQFAAAGIREIVLCTGHMAESVREHFGDGSAFGVRVWHSVESAPLGTAGAVKRAEPALAGDRWLLMN